MFRLDVCVVAFILACRWFWSSATMLLLSPTLLLIHEIALFVALPLIAITFMMSFGNSHRRHATILLFVSVTLAGLPVLALQIYGKMHVPFALYAKYLSTED